MGVSGGGFGVEVCVGKLIPGGLSGVQGRVGSMGAAPGGGIVPWGLHPS